MYLSESNHHTQQIQTCHTEKEKKDKELFNTHSNNILVNDHQADSHGEIGKQWKEGQALQVTNKDQEDHEWQETQHVYS